MLTVDDIRRHVATLDVTPWLLDYMTDGCVSVAQSCVDAAEVYDVNWRELSRHLRRRFAELGWR